MSGVEGAGRRQYPVEDELQITRPYTQRTRGKLVDARWAAITAAMVAVIVWGSLYPFAFRHRGTAAMGLRFLLMTWRLRPDRGDLMANVLLYSPLGFFAVRSLGRLGFAARAAMVTLFGALLSAGIEFAQFWDLGREPSVSDVYSNAIGTLAGAMVAGLNPRRWNFPLLGKIEWRPYALLLVVLWLGNRLFPYIPSLDWRHYEIAWTPLVTQAAFLDLYRQTANWLAVAALVEALFGVDRSRIAIAMTAGLVIVARVLIGVAAPPDEISALAAAILWIGIFSRIRIRGVLVASLFTVSVTLQALEPFHFVEQARQFGWIPFVSFINGPRENGVRVFFEKAFTYGVLVWLIARAGASWVRATAMSTILVLGLRMAQVYLPGRSAEITDAAMLVMLASIMKLMGDVPEG